MSESLEGRELARRTAYMRKPVSESLEGRELARRTAYMRKPVSESLEGPGSRHSVNWTTKEELV